MPTYRINAATISWISQPPMQAYASVPNPFADGAWLTQIAFGMAHTANPEPPADYDASHYKPGAALQKQYRALTTFTVGLRTGGGGAFEAVTSLPATMEPDPGYTPPFDSPWLARAGALGQELITISPGISAEIMGEAGKFSAGEASSLSKIVQPALNTWQQSGVPPLPYGSIKPAPGETVLGHSLIKFRAGSVGDRIGIVVFGAGNHVPWVWCEMMVTYTANTLVLYCAGSIFPTHGFYLGGRRQETDRQHASEDALRSVFTSGLKAQVQTTTTMAAPQAPSRVVLQSVNAQSPKHEPATTIPVDRQAYVAPAQRLKRKVIPLGSMPLLTS